MNKAYRTISHEANLVIAGIIPIDLIIKERMNVHADIEAGMVRTISKRLRRRETLNAVSYTHLVKKKKKYEYLSNAISGIATSAHSDFCVTSSTVAKSCPFVVLFILGKRKCCISACLVFAV